MLLRRLERATSDESGWFTVPLVDSSTAAQSFYIALRLASDTYLTGWLALAFHLGRSLLAPKALASIATHVPLIVAAIEAAARSEAAVRVDRLHSLAREVFNLSELELDRWNFDFLVAEVKKIFRADTVTLFLADEEDLLLAASTSPSLRQRKDVVYRRGEGLTGWVWESRRALRLRNTEDQEDPAHPHGLEREGPKFSEARPNDPPPLQYLAAPLRFAEIVFGVLRMSRAAGREQFSFADETALQYFADLTGPQLAAWLRLKVAVAILDSATDAIGITRLGEGSGGSSVSRLILANRGLQRLLGRSEKEILRRDVKELYGPGEYRRVQELLRPVLAEARGQGRAESEPFRTELLRSDGARVPVSMTFRIQLRPHVHPPTIYTLAVARDLTESERRAAEHSRLLESLDAMGIAYTRADREGHTINPTATDSRFTGYPVAELTELNRRDLYVDPTQRDRAIAEARGRQGQRTRLLTKLRRRDETTFWAEGDLRVIPDGEGGELVEGFYRDVTDRVRLQGFLNLPTDQLLPDDQLFTQLKRDAEFHLDYLSNVGHQMQAPLSSLVGTLESFQRSVDRPELLRDRLPYVLSQARVCSRLVRNLSYMDKILRGETFEQENVPLAKLAIETKLDFLAQAKAKSIEIEIDDESLRRHLVVQGHRELLRQVLVNLVDNALKYSLPKSVVHIRGHHWPGGRVLEISNRGLPVPEADRRRLFERGFRSAAAKAVVPHGSGLGLWLVREILALHQATVSCVPVADERGALTAFRITFPHPAPSRAARREP